MPIFSPSDFAAAIQVRTSLAEIQRHQMGLMEQEGDLDLSQPLAELKTKGTINKPMVVSHLAHGIATHAVTLPKEVPVGTVLSVFDPEVTERLSVVVALSPLPQAVKVYVRELAPQEVEEMVIQYPKLQPVSVGSAQVEKISEAKGTLISVLKAIDQVRTIFFQAILRFFLFKAPSKTYNSNNFIRIYVRILVVALILFCASFLWLILGS